MKLRLTQGLVILVSAYASTLDASEEMQDASYCPLKASIRILSPNLILILLSKMGLNFRMFGASNTN